MHHSKELQRKIQAHLPIHGARISFITRFVLALIVVRGVTLSTVASAMNPKVLPESNEKRIKRFFGKGAVEGQSFASLLLALLPVKDGLVLTLDRTTWEIGSCCINVLMLGAAYKGLAFPLLWVLLDKKGNSDTEERFSLLAALLALVAALRIEAIVANREFTGKPWFQGLKQRRLIFVMRVRNNTLIGAKGTTRSAQKRYSYLNTQEVYVCPKRCWVFGLRLCVGPFGLGNADTTCVAVTKSKEGEELGPTGRALPVLGN